MLPQKKKTNFLKWFILLGAIVFLLILVACLIVGIILLVQELTSTNVFKFKFIYAGMVGISSFLMILIGLNFSHFLMSNKDWIKMQSKKIFWKGQQHD